MQINSFFHKMRSAFALFLTIPFNLLKGITRMTDNKTPEQLHPQEPAVQSQPQTPQESAATQQPEQVNYKELYVRLAADMQNFKRRIEKERSEWTETAQGIIISALLPFFEDFDRAIANTPQLTEQEGLILIQKNLKKTLADLGVNEIEAAGQFNPEYHEALAQVEAENHASNDIVQVFNKGYMFKGKVLKHAQVSVAK